MSRYTASKTACSGAERERFACAFLNSTNPFQGVDWEAAARDWDSTVKPESFKTMTLKAMTKAKKKAESDEFGGGEGEGKKPAAKGKGGGKKRKAADDGDDGEDGEPAPKKAQGKGGKRGKRAKADSVTEEDGAEVDGAGESEQKVKAEVEDEEGDLF